MTFSASTCSLPAPARLLALLPLFVALAACGGRSPLDEFAAVAPDDASSPLDATSPREATTPDTFVAPVDAPRVSSDAPTPSFDASFPALDGSGATNCVACLALTCADNYIQCEQGSACFSIYQCLVNGGSDADCLCRAPSGADAYLALVRCIEQVACTPGECTALCANSPADRYCTVGPAAPTCDGGPVTVTQQGSPLACEGCVASSCGVFSQACGPESDCVDYIDCLATCGTEECPNDCAAAHAAGQSASEAIDVCLGGACEAECSF